MVPYDRNVPHNNLPPLPLVLECYNTPELIRKLTDASRKLAEFRVSKMDVSSRAIRGLKPKHGTIK